jgi:hypothetical protein
MGTLRGDNGGNERPPEGGGLPGLPPEWGTVIVPDDPGALDHEGSTIRRSFRREALRRRWRRRFHLGTRPLAWRADDDTPGLAVPLLIMTVAIIATLSSLFAVAWPGQRPRVEPTAAARNPQSISVGEIGMVDADGARVPLRDVSPAVVLLIEDCTCEAFVSATYDALTASRPTPSSTPAAAATAKAVTVSILVVDTGVPKLPALAGATVPVRALADPNHSLRSAVPALAPTGGATMSAAVLLIDKRSTVTKVVADVRSVDDFKAELPGLW